MFRIFKKKTEKEKLSAQYNKLMKEAFELSKVNRARSDEKYTEAHALRDRLDQLN